MRKRFGISLLLATLMLLSQVISVGAYDPNSNIVPPDQTAYGKTYYQWAEAWYQWLFPLWGQKGVNLFGGSECVSLNQNQEVFFLTGTSGGNHVERHCSIPAGRPLFFPVLNTAYFEDPAVYDHSMKPPYVPATWVKLLYQALAPDNTSLQAWIDDVPVANLRDYLVVTDPQKPFPVNIPAFGIKNWEGVQGGFYLLVNPLSPGKHTIRILADQHQPVEIPVPEGVSPAAFPAFQVDLNITLRVG
ncbi:MAG TPA: hypothetical protein VH186_14655 [Chloroflexia bacterium]|nr:hypothetical protein [Chloroflexia bacterium]